ncbi:MAG: cytochrome c oxidase subunit II [Dehalococcoidia bacterium]
MNRHLTIAGVLWVVFTVLSLWGAMAMNPFPTVGAQEATLFDHAFRLMTYMGAPVFGFMMAALIYSVLHFRAKNTNAGAPTEDGPPIHGHGAIPKIWVGVTTALCLVVMIYPGLTGLAEIRADRSHDVEVKVTGSRWVWALEYPQGGFQADELVLPVGKRVKFDLTAPAGDVLHSFWVPAFRQKLTTLPGQMTYMYITPTQTGDGHSDAAFRVQCSELCGLLHSRMQLNVRVVEQAEYDKWVAEKVKK